MEERQRLKEQNGNANKPRPRVGRVPTDIVTTSSCSWSRRSGRETILAVAWSAVQAGKSWEKVLVIARMWTTRGPAAC